MTSKFAYLLIIITLLLNCTVSKEHELNFIFPKLHYNSDWEISNGRSLWRILIANNIAEPPIRMNSSGNFQSGIFEGWTFFEDKKILKVKISEKYHFHDGSKVTPEIVLSSVVRTMRKKKTAHSNLYNLFCNENQCPGIKLKQNTLTFSMRQHQNGILRMLAVPEYGVTPPKYNSATGDKKHLLQNLSGPYSVSKFRKNKMELTAQKHPLISESSPKRVNILGIAKLEDRIDFYRKNKNTVIFGYDYSSGVKVLKEKGNRFISKPVLTEFIIPNIFGNKFNTIAKRKKFFSIFRKIKSKLNCDKRVAKTTDQLFTPDNLAYLPGNLNIYFDEAPSQYEKKLNLKMYAFEHEKENPLHMEIKRLLMEYNIDLSLEYLPPKTLVKLIKEHDFDLVYMFGGVGVQDPLIELSYIYNKSLRSEFVKNPYSEGLMDKAMHETNREKYTQLVRKIHADMLFTYRLLPVTHVNLVFLTNGDFRLTKENGEEGFNFWAWHQTN